MSRRVEKRQERKETNGVEVDLSLQTSVSNKSDNPLLSLFSSQVETSRQVAVEGKKTALVSERTREKDVKRKSNRDLDSLDIHSLVDLAVRLTDQVPRVLQEQLRLSLSTRQEKVVRDDLLCRTQTLLGSLEVELGVQPGDELRQRILVLV